MTPSDTPSTSLTVVRDDSGEPVWPEPLVVPGVEYKTGEISRMYKAAIEAAGEEAIFDLYMQLGSVSKVCRALGIHPNSRNWIYWWLHEQDDWTDTELESVGGSTRWQRWEKIRRAHGHAAAEHSVEVLDDATPVNVRVKAEQSKAHRWLAEQYNREHYGQRRDVQMTGELTLAASWAHALEHDAEQQKVLEAEIVEDED